MSVRIKVLAVIGFLALPVKVWASSSGPPNSVTGAPGEGTCANCHGNLNTGSGSVSLSAPIEYTAGDTFDISVGLQQIGQMRWGFEVTILNAANQPVGNIIVTDLARTQLAVASNGRQYIKHTSTGTDNGAPNVAPGWSFRWASPPSGAGAVSFYVAGNAANGNGSSSGDFIYTTSQAVTQAGCLAQPGDVNGMAPISLPDVIHLVNYVFDKDRPATGCLGSDTGNCWIPEPVCRGETNGTSPISLPDVIHLVNYVFDKDRPMTGCLGSDPGNCWTPMASGVCCLPVEAR